MARSRRVRVRSIGPLLVAALALVACQGSSPPADAGDAAADTGMRLGWTCPTDWVPLAVGGCAPAVLACASDGGATPGACAAVNLSTPHIVTDADGGTGTSFYRGADGTIHGGWHEEGDPNGYPAIDFTPDAGNGSSADAWAPDAGIGSCPTGWTALADGTCDVNLPTNCTAGAAPLPRGTCTATGTGDCPTGAYADVGAESVGATVVHVLAGSDPTVADGSIAHPYATIAAGIAAATSDGWVLVGAGTYAESVAPTASVHIVGVCAARVSIQTAGATAAVHAAGSGVSLDLRGVTLTGAGPGLVVDSAAHATLTSVAVAATQPRGLVATGTGTQLTGTDVYVHDLMPTMNDPGNAPGVLVMSGAAVTLSRIAIDHASQQSVWAFDNGSNVALSDAAITNTLAGNNPITQAAVLSFANANVSLDRALLDGNAINGVTAIGSGALVMNDCVVRNTTQTMSTPAIALEASTGSLTATRVLVTGTQGTSVGVTDSTVTLSQSVLRGSSAAISSPTTTGLGVDAAGGTVRVDHTVVSGAVNVGVGMTTGTNPGMLALSQSVVQGTVGAAGNVSIGVSVAGGSQAEVSASLVERNGNIGVNANGAMSSMSVVGSVVRDETMTAAMPAAGLTASAGASMTVASSVIAGITGAGVVVQNPGTQFAMQDSVVRDVSTTPFQGMAFGGGIIVAEGTVAALTRTRVDGVGMLGVIVAQQQQTGTSLTIDDSRVDNTTAQAIDAMGHVFAAGVGVSFGASVVMERTIVAHSGPLGAFAQGDGSTLAIRDCAIEGIHVGSADRAAASLMAYSGGAIQAERLLVTDGQDTGLVAIANGTLDLSDTLVQGIAPDALGFGTGIVASGNGTVTVHRVAVMNVAGAALMTTPYADPATPEVTGASLTGEDVYVHGVASSAIRVTYDANGAPMSNGPPVAYGAHAGTSCSLSIDRGVFDQAGYGFFLSSGSLTLRTGVVSSMLDAAGAQNGANASLQSVAFVGNAQNAVVPGPDLPEGAMLQTPQPACSTPSCL